MLREWMQNLPQNQIETILADQSVAGKRIWHLAWAEYQRRRMAA